MAPLSYNRIRVLIRTSAVLLVLAVVGFLIHDASSSLYFRKHSIVRSWVVHQPLAHEILIPRRIWQIFFASPELQIVDPSTYYATDWISLAPDYTYTLVGTADADAFVDHRFVDRPEIGQTYHALHNPALKSDLLRYLLLLAAGGVYSDMDTKPIARLDEWIPAEKRREIRLIVGIEYDESVDEPLGNPHHFVQFCQWTIAAAPGHPILENMVATAISRLGNLADAQETTLDHVKFSDTAVHNSTGPVAWTEVVFETLQTRAEKPLRYKDFAGLKEPMYFGDIAVLPIEAFRANNVDDWGLHWGKDRRPLVRHFYANSWKKLLPTFR